MERVMPIPPYLASLRYKRTDQCPDDMMWQPGGKLFCSRDVEPVRVWVALNVVPVSLKLYGSPDEEDKNPPFLHYDLEMVLREKQVGGERHRFKEKIGYIDTRENKKTGKPFYVVQLWAMPVVRVSTKGCLWLMADTKL